MQVLSWDELEFVSGGDIVAEVIVHAPMNDDCAGAHIQRCKPSGNLDCTPTEP